MGHEPWVNMKVRGDKRIICDDNFERIMYDEEEFYSYLEKAETEFYKFVDGPMTERLFTLCPEKAEEFMNAFRFAFDYDPDTEDE